MTCPDCIGLINKRQNTMGFIQEIPNTRKPPFFSDLRKNKWVPRFHWEPSLDAVADVINRPHDDYPARITATKAALQQTIAELDPSSTITLHMFRNIHRTIFPDHGDQAGQWRTINVQVADHIAPRWEQMEKLMEELEYRYRDAVLTPETLKHWYHSVNSIHPMRDGNGRTSGVVIAAFSYHRYSIHLAPDQ